MLDNYYDTDNDSTENIVYKELLSKLLLFHINTFCNKNKLTLILKWTTSLRLLYNLPRSFEVLKFDIIWNIDNWKINKLLTYLEKNLDKDINIQKINKFIYKISCTLDWKEINININIDIYKKILWDTEDKLIQNNLVINNFITPFYFKVKTYNLETIFIQNYLDITLDNKIENIFNIWWYFLPYNTNNIKYLNLTTYKNKLQHLGYSEKINFGQYFRDSLNETLSTKTDKEKIINNIKNQIPDNFILKDFEISLNNKDFLIKSYILDNLPIK